MTAACDILAWDLPLANASEGLAAGSRSLHGCTLGWPSIAYRPYQTERRVDAQSAPSFSLYHPGDHTVTFGLEHTALVGDPFDRQGPMTEAELEVA